MSFLSDAINAADPSKKKTTELTLALQLLTELCNQKVESFTSAIENELRTAGSGENQTMPVTQILARHQENRAYVSSDISKIPNEVADAVQDFFTGGSEAILKGITKLVTTALTAIVGDGNALEQEMSTYYVVVQDYGIARYDIRVFSRRIEAEGIVKHIEKALAIVAFKSSVDVSKMTFNSFLIAYSDQLKALGFDKGTVQEYVDTAWKVYSDLRRDTPVPPSSGVSQLSGSRFVRPGELVISAR
jgi:hypothetical protein